MIFKNQDGAALLLVLLMMTALLGAAGWLALQTRTETSVVVAAKNYAKSFNVADGSLQVAVHYLRNIANPTHENFSWNPKKAGGGEVGVNGAYKNYININGNQMFDVVNSTDDIDGRSEIRWLDYSTTPPPGWGLGERGYGNKFGTYQYKAIGRGALKFGSSGNTKAVSQVSALILRISS